MKDRSIYKARIEKEVSTVLIHKCLLNPPRSFINRIDAQLNPRAVIISGIHGQPQPSGARYHGDDFPRVAFDDFPSSRSGCLYRAASHKAAFFRERAYSSFPSIAVIDNTVHDTFTRARPICRHKSLETKTYPRGHANLPTPDRRWEGRGEGQWPSHRESERSVKSGTETGIGESDRWERVNKREIMTRASFHVCHTRGHPVHTAHGTRTPMNDRVGRGQEREVKR